jgi:hypothetical protein
MHGTTSAEGGKCVDLLELHKALAVTTVKAHAAPHATFMQFTDSDLSCVSKAIKIEALIANSGCSCGR